MGGKGSTIIASIITINTGPASVRKPERLIKSCIDSNTFMMSFLLQISGLLHGQICSPKFHKTFGWAPE
jgi:hypothetical protein